MKAVGVKESLVKRSEPRGKFVPAVVANAGPRVSKLFLEFFAATIRNKNTREAYFRNVRRFFIWCEKRRIPFERIEPMVVAAYIERLTDAHPAETVKQHLAAVRRLFDYLVINQVVPVNPAASVKGPRVETVEGKTPVLTAEEAGTLLDSIDASDLIGQRDRAIVALMLFTFARVGAVARLQVSDFYKVGDSWRVRLKEKGSKSRELPVVPEAAGFIKSYIANAGLAGNDFAPLFQSFQGTSQLPTGKKLHRNNILHMIKRRAMDAGLPASTCCHTFRATGLTIYMANGGELQHAQRIAGHADPRTTQLYIRNSDEIDLAELKKVELP